MTHLATSRIPLSPKPTWISRLAYLAVCFVLFAAAGFAGIYEVPWSVVAPGGSSYGGGFNLKGTLAQPVTGTMSGGGYSLDGGFEVGNNNPGVTCLGDINVDGRVDSLDLTMILAAWGDCSDCSNCPAELTGDCFIDGVELGIVLSAWGTCEP